MVRLSFLAELVVWWADVRQPHKKRPATRCAAGLEL